MVFLLIVGVCSVAAAHGMELKDLKYLEVIEEPGGKVLRIKGMYGDPYDFVHPRWKKKGGYDSPKPFYFYVFQGCNWFIRNTLTSIYRCHQKVKKVTFGLEGNEIWPLSEVERDASRSYRVVSVMGMPMTNFSCFAERNRTCRPQGEMDLFASLRVLSIDADRRWGV